MEKRRQNRKKRSPEDVELNSYSYLVSMAENSGVGEFGGEDFGGEILDPTGGLAGWIWQGWLKNRRIVHYLSQHVPKAGEVRKKLAACGSRVVVKRYANGESRAFCVDSCSYRRLCLICSAKERRRRVAELTRYFQALLQREPSLKFAVVTLTVKSGSDLMAQYLHLKTSWKRLRRRCTEARRGRVKTEWLKVRAGVASIEVDRGQSGDWHVHLHIPLLYERELDDQAISDEWLRVTGDSHVTHIKRIPLAKGIDEDSLRERINGEVGYVLKFRQLSPADLWEAHCTLHGQQLSRMFGEFIGLELPEREKFGSYTAERFVLGEWGFVSSESEGHHE
jgi:hypothetical protein